jgi:ParB-like chromosome segregation protein Spo0J
VRNLVRLLELPEEILELLERGELSKSHGKALLVARDPQVRSRLAREAIEQGWPTRTLEARARESNAAEAAPGSPAPAHGSASPTYGSASSRPNSVHAPGNPVRTDGVNELISNVARVCGDLLGVEVGVRTLRGRQLRVEVVFTSPEAALNVGGRLSDQVARAKKRR